MALGLLLLITSIVRQDLDTNSIILIVALFAFGFGSIMRSISQRMAKEDKLEELDERNRLIALKSKSKSFQLTQIISFVLMLALLVMGKVSGYEGFIAMGVGLAFAFTISMFAEFFTYMYYESKIRREFGMKQPLRQRPVKDERDEQIDTHSKSEALDL